MRRLHVISSTDPSLGGPIEGIVQLARAQLDPDVVVEIASSDSPDAPWLSSGAVPHVHALGPGWLSYGYNPRLLQWLRQNAANYDAVIVDGLWQYHSLATWRALRNMSTPYFVFTHGMLDPWFKRRYPLKHVKKWAYWPWAE